MSALALALALVVCWPLAAAAPCAAERVQVEFVVRAPAGMPADAELFVAGNVPELGRWSPRGVALAKSADGIWRATVEVERGVALEFKVTCGSWATVEKGQGGGEIPNRRAVAGEDVTPLEVTVAAFASAAPPRSTVTGKLVRHDRFASSRVGARDVLVWLPPGYEGTELRCPVLYMHDGQNLFDTATAFGGVEWSADETADRLIRARAIPPILIVGITNTPARITDYTPVPSPAFPGSGGGDAYVAFLADELKPFIDARYRTHPEPAQTFVGGSSLGGLISLHALFARPAVFGGAAALSPSLGWSDEWLRGQVGAHPEALRGRRIWLDMGTREASGPTPSNGAADPSTHDERDAAFVAQLRRFAAALEPAGLARDRDFVAREFAGAAHNEAAWAARFEEVLRFLFAPPPRKPDGGR